MSEQIEMNKYVVAACVEVVSETFWTTKHQKAVAQRTIMAPDSETAEAIGVSRILAIYREKHPNCKVSLFQSCAVRP